jgi:dihydrofolate reductase
MEIVLVVAVADNGVIGAGGAIPWRLKTDLQRFKAITMGTSLAAAREVATGDALRRFVTEIAVIGGAEIYAQWMGSADRLEVTEVHASPAGDTRLAPIDKAHWEEVARVRHGSGPDDSAEFSFVTYRRKRSH